MKCELSQQNTQPSWPTLQDLGRTSLCACSLEIPPPILCFLLRSFNRFSLTRLVFFPLGPACPRLILVHGGHKPLAAPPSPPPPAYAHHSGPPFSCPPWALTVIFVHGTGRCGLSCRLPSVKQTVRGPKPLNRPPTILASQCVLRLGRPRPGSSPRTASSENKHDHYRQTAVRESPRGLLRSTSYTAVYEATRAPAKRIRLCRIVTCSINKLAHDLVALRIR